MKHQLLCTDLPSVLCSHPGEEPCPHTGLQRSWPASLTGLLADASCTKAEENLGEPQCSQSGWLSRVMFPRNTEELCYICRLALLSEKSWLSEQDICLSEQADSREGVRSGGQGEGREGQEKHWKVGGRRGRGEGIHKHPMPMLSKDQLAQRPTLIDKTCFKNAHHISN